MVVRGGAEECARFGILEQLPLLFGKPNRQLQMAPVELSFVEIEQPLDEHRVVIEKTWNRGIARAIAAQQRAARGIVQMADDELRCTPRGLSVAGIVEHRSALGEGRNHEAIPGGENLVVQVRAHALCTSLQENASGAIELRLHFAGRPAEVARRLFHGVRLVREYSCR